MIIDNPDEDLRLEAEKQLQLMKFRYGKRYCPCAFERTKDTICPCKDFRNQIEQGECNCGRYCKI